MQLLHCLNTIEENRLVCNNGFTDWPMFDLEPVLYGPQKHRLNLFGILNAFPFSLPPSPALKMHELAVYQQATPLKMLAWILKKMKKN